MLCMPLPHSRLVELFGQYASKTDPRRTLASQPLLFPGPPNLLTFLVPRTNSVSKNCSSRIYCWRGPLQGEGGPRLPGGAGLQELGSGEGALGRRLPDDPAPRDFFEIRLKQHQLIAAGPRSFRSGSKPCGGEEAKWRWWRSGGAWTSSSRLFHSAQLLRQSPALAHTSPYYYIQPRSPFIQ